MSMKLHRVLLFTSIQMDITPVGKDLHVLLTNDQIPYIGSAVYARIISMPSPEEEQTEPECEFLSIDNSPDSDSLLCRYVAEILAKKTGQNVLCTGGIFVDNPSDRDIAKLYENIDEMIRDWCVFFTDD